MKLIRGCHLVQSREEIVLKKNLVEQVICFQESGTADQKLQIIKKRKQHKIKACFF